MMDGAALMKEMAPCPVQTIIVLLDHDNLKADPRTMIRAIASTVSLDRLVSVRIRAYGGWFVGATTTDSRASALDFYQDNCPVVMECGESIIRVAFEFADDLAAGTLRERRVNVTHTLGLRRSAGELLPRTTSVQCLEPACKVRELRKWVRRKTACSLPTCAHPFDSFFQRREQKQVDVHLTGDLLFYSSDHQNYGCVAVVSDDLDLVPAILQAALQAPSSIVASVRSSLRGPTYQDSLLEDLGAKIIILP